MLKLTELDCESCTPTSKAVVGAEREDLMLQIPDWSIRQVDGIPRLERRFRFKDFASALEFTNLIGELAETEDHHPELVTEWGACTVSWWTHSIGGLHMNDFILAARSDRIFGS